MAKKKEIEEEVEETNPPVGSGRPPAVGDVQPLTQEFGNGDLNVLRDKINEIIAKL